MTSYTSARTEVRKAATLREGDHILDPDDRKPRILTIWHIERYGDVIFVHAIKSRSVLRKLFPGQDVDVCIPR